jgi:hypothetical protein
LYSYDSLDSIETGLLTQFHKNKKNDDFEDTGKDGFNDK